MEIVILKVISLSLAKLDIGKLTVAMAGCANNLSRNAASASRSVAMPVRRIGSTIVLFFEKLVSTLGRRVLKYMPI